MTAMTFGEEGVDVRMKIEVLPEGVDGHDDAGDALGQVQGRAQVFCQAFTGQATEDAKQNQEKIWKILCTCAT
jgi:hypothetical protein